ncbi:MAG TPA: LysR family transcriptional regulator [Burkholderiales bacterium]
MDRLDVMKLFLRVVETGSFSNAGRSVGLGQPSVSKHIGALEEHLGTTLLRRSSRNLALTAEGRIYHEGIRQVLRKLEALESSLASSAAPRGTLRVSMLAAFGRMYVMPRLAEFHRRYPQLALEFDISERYVNLGEDAVDVAIRLGHFTDPRLALRRIGMARVYTLAAPQYLARRGAPKTLGELDEHDCIGFMHRGEVHPWEFKTPEGKVPHVPKGPLCSNDVEYIRSALLDGVGIAHIPTWLVAQQLRAGSVVRVLGDYAPDDYPISVVWPAGAAPSAAIEALIEFLSEACADHPELRGD